MCIQQNNAYLLKEIYFFLLEEFAQSAIKKPSKDLVKQRPFSVGHTELSIPILFLRYPKIKLKSKVRTVEEEGVRLFPSWSKFHSPRTSILLGWQGEP